MTSRLISRVIVTLMAVLLGACASFDHHWKEGSAGRNGKTCWDGKWISEKHHEDGHLRCVLEPQGKTLAAHFHANWLIFSDNFDMILKPVPGPRNHRVLAYRGTQELPMIFGGTYQYDATIGGKKFNAHYSSSYDYGTFVLHRVFP